MLGTVDRQQVLGLAARLADRDARGAVRAHRGDRRVRAGLRAAARRGRGAAAEGGAAPGRARAARRTRCTAPEALESLAARMPAEDLQLAYQIAILGRRDLDLAPDPRTGFEMTLAAHARLPPGGGQQAPGARRRPSGTAPTAGGRRPRAARQRRRRWPRRETGRRCSRASNSRAPARQLAGNCQLLSREGDHFRFLLDERASALHTRQLEDRFVQALRALRRRSRRPSRSSAAAPATRRLGAKSRRGTSASSRRARRSSAIPPCRRCATGSAPCCSRIRSSRSGRMRA